MRIKIIAARGVAEWPCGAVVNVSAVQGEKLVTTGYAVVASDEPKKVKAA